MEGGAIDVNGAGCVLTTEQCLLNPNRNPHLSREEIEDYLKTYRRQQGPVARRRNRRRRYGRAHRRHRAVCSPNTIVCAVEEDPEDANYELLQDNLTRLKSMTDAGGRPFEIVTLPMPGVVGGTSTDTRNLDRLPASYANFYIANNVVLAPVFGHANDARAVKHFSACSRSTWSRSTANHSFGAWARSTASQQQPQP